MRRPLLLLIEQDRQLSEMLVAALERDYLVETVSTTQDALAKSRHPNHAAFVVDVGSAAGDALKFVTSVRIEGDERAIVAMVRLFRHDLPARCYEAGADAWVSKTGPLVRELRAILNRLLLKRRGTTALIHRRTDGILLPSRPFKFAGGLVTPAAMSIKFPRQTQAFELNPKEVGILDCFARGRGKLVRRAEILAQIWGPAARPRSRSLDTYLTRLRQVYRRGGVDLKKVIRNKSKVGWRVVSN